MFLFSIVHYLRLYRPQHSVCCFMSVEAFSDLLTLTTLFSRFFTGSTSKLYRDCGFGESNSEILFFICAKVIWRNILNYLLVICGPCFG
mmetsp:Transcript_27392/g.72302  ORF Transcript_27392/g.72302 Transcript_27392/m.72302 type:complete len:89 (+) Transcript_27392:700-966(+)